MLWGLSLSLHMMEDLDLTAMPLLRTRAIMLSSTDWYLMQGCLWAAWLSTKRTFLGGRLLPHAANENEFPLGVEYAG